MTPMTAPEPFVRTPLVRISGLVSSYPAAKPYPERYDLADPHCEHTAWAPRYVWDALVRLQAVMEAEGGTVGITEVYRSMANSRLGHALYVAGKRPEYVADAGESAHNAGIAVDLDVWHARFPGLDPDGWIRMLWDLCVPLGWRPIARRPEMSAPERHHLDCVIEWGPTLDWFRRHRPSHAYTGFVRCGILDAGAWDRNVIPVTDEWLAVAYCQAQLHRVGIHEVGMVDGVAGPLFDAARRRVAGGKIGNLEGLAERLNGMETRRTT